MKVRATEIKNNLGRYLKLCREEDIYITRNGITIARLCNYEDPERGGYLVVKEGQGAYAYTGKRVSYEEFLKIAEGNQERYEYLNGEVTLLSSPGITHQLIQSNITRCFLNWFDGKKCRVFSSPFDVTLTNRDTNQKNVVQPDILISCDYGTMRDGKDRYTGIPAMTVEILSPETKGRDCIRKLDLYLNGCVSEYWIADPTEEKILVYSFANRQLDTLHVYKPGDTVRSAIFEGLSIPVCKVFTG